VARVIDQRIRLKTWEVVLTDFSPPELAETQRVFSRLTEVHCLGRISTAERQRGALAREEVAPDRLKWRGWKLPVIFYLILTATFAILGTGIVRDKTGDITW